jgi:protein SCO1/2
VLLGAVAIMAAVLVAACGGSSPAELRGTVLNPPQRAAEFTLVDQFGESVSLSQKRGEVVVLTFLYTYCPDICPVVASHLTEIHEQLSGDGDIADKFSIIAISVDPERDTVERAHEYSARYGMLKNWTYLVGVGNEGELAKIWAAYFVSAAPRQGDDPEPDPLLLNQDGSIDSLLDRIAAAYTVDHQAPVYVIDRDGMMRSLFTLPFSPEDIAADVRVLLRQ